MGYAILQFIVIFALLLALAIPLGRYLYVVFFKETSKLDRFFLPIEKIIYRASGIKNLEETGWKKYSFAFLSVNAVLLGISYLIVRMQKYLPFNSAKIDGTVKNFV